MASYVENPVKLDWSKSFNRVFKGPLDRSSMLSSYEDAVKYAKGDSEDPDSRGLYGTSYVGQIITVFENDVVSTYKINADRTLEEIVSANDVDNLLAKKVDTQFTETIPASAITFTNGKNGFQVWAWKDENDEWHCVCVNKPAELIGPEIPGKGVYDAVSFSTSSYDGSFGVTSENCIWGADIPGFNYFEGNITEGHVYPLTSVTTAPINPASFTDNLTTTAAKAKIAESLPAPIAPSTSDSATGKAADAKATGDMLADKMPLTGASVENGEIEFFTSDDLGPAEYANISKEGFAVGDHASFSSTVYKHQMIIRGGRGGGYEIWLPAESGTLALLSNILARIAPEFAAKTGAGAYAEGAMVTYDGSLYKRNTTTGADTSWDSTHWTKLTNLSGVLSGLKSDGNATNVFATNLLDKPVSQNIISTIVDAQVSSKVIVEDMIESHTYTSLSVVKMPRDEYELSVASGVDLSGNVLYVLEADDINAYGQRIKNVGWPISADDAATKSYVDVNIAKNKTIVACLSSIFERDGSPVELDAVQLGDVVSALSALYVVMK